GDEVIIALWAGARAEVEHGLDERHTALPGGGTDQPALPPRGADVLPGVRVLRAVRAAAEPRRGGARQGFAVAEDARRPVGEARRGAAAARLPVDPPGQEAAVHGWGVRAEHRVERGAVAELGARRHPVARGGAGDAAAAEPALPRAPGALG